LIEQYFSNKQSYFRIQQQQQTSIFRFLNSIILNLKLTLTILQPTIPILNLNKIMRQIQEIIINDKQEIKLYKFRIQDQPNKV